MGKGLEQTFLQRGSTGGQHVREKVLSITDHQRNANRTAVSGHRTPVRMAAATRQNTGVRRMQRNEPCALQAGIRVAQSRGGNCMAIPPKLNSRITMRSSNPTSGYKPKRTELRVFGEILVHHVHSGIIDIRGGSNLAGH